MIIACIISFIVGAMIMTLALNIVSLCKDKEPRNKVHFYVARDKDETLWLYIGKPIREDESFQPHSDFFEDFGLNINDYEDLKWEDEPVEVLLNMKD